MGKERKGNVIFAGESADGRRSDFKGNLRGRGLQKVAAYLVLVHWDKATMNAMKTGWNCASIQLLLSFALELALALSVKRYTCLNDYTRSMKVNTAV